MRKKLSILDRIFVSRSAKNVVEHLEVTHGAPNDLARGVTKHNPIYGGPSDYLYEPPFSDEFWPAWYTLSSESQNAILNQKERQQIPSGLLDINGREISSEQKGPLQGVFKKHSVRGVLLIAKSSMVEAGDIEAFCSAWEKLNDDGQELFFLGVLNIVIAKEATQEQLVAGIKLHGENILQDDPQSLDDAWCLGTIYDNIEEEGRELNPSEKQVLAKYSAAQWENIQQSKLEQDGPDSTKPGPRL